MALAVSIGMQRETDHRTAFKQSNRANAARNVLRSWSVWLLRCFDSLRKRDKITERW
jgi:hypothetical protein